MSELDRSVDLAVHAMLVRRTARGRADGVVASVALRIRRTPQRRGVLSRLIARLTPPDARGAWSPTGVRLLLVALVAVLTLLAVLAVATIGSRPPSPSPAPRLTSTSPGVLVYLSGLDVYTLDPAGGTSWRVFTLPRLLTARTVQWSRDGSRILLGGGESIGADGSDLRKIGPSPGPWAPGAWSPDGTRYATIPGTGLDIADGSNVRHLPFPPGVTSAANLSWSPDGGSLAMVARGGCSGTNVLYPWLGWALWVVATDGSGSRCLYASDGDMWPPDAAPTWSPDGSTVAIVKGYAGTDAQGVHVKSVIHIASVDGAPAVSIPLQGIPGAHAVWSPDGSRLALDGDGPPTEEPAHLYLIDRDGTGLRELTTEPTRDVRPVWSADGSWIAFGRAAPGTWPETFSLWVVRSDGTGARKVVDAADSFDLIGEGRSRGVP